MFRIGMYIRGGRKPSGVAGLHSQGLKRSNKARLDNIEHLGTMEGISDMTD
jgi:hypothetical protein